MTLTSAFGRRWGHIATATGVALLVVLALVATPGAPALFYPAFGLVVVLASLMVGRSAGYLAVSLTALLLALFNFKGEGFAVSDPIDAMGLVLFILFGVATVTAAGAARDRLAKAQGERDAARSAAEINAQLLAEFSHRLMNDLSSLVFIAHLRADEAASAETREALEDIGKRLEVTAQIYSRLRLSEHQGGETDVAAFIADLCDDFRRAHLALRPISLETRLQTRWIEPRRVVIVGLVLNELLTNAAKYAFPGDVGGAIAVRFESIGAARDKLRLRVQDDGGGLGNSRGEGTGVGQKLVRAMASQLHGTFHLAREGGLTVAELVFPATDEATQTQTSRP